MPYLELNTDVKRAFIHLNEKAPYIGRYLNYYDGNAPLSVITERLREIFRGLDIHLAQNWTEVVINATSDRINLTGFTVTGNETAQAILTQAWAEFDLAIEADDVHTVALAAGEAYVIAWPEEGAADDPEAGPELQIFFNDPRMCHIFYDPANPRKKRMAAKWWDDDEGKRRLTLYYPDHIEYYVSTVKADALERPDQFEMDGAYIVNTDEDISSDLVEWPENPYGVIPVFHFRLDRRTCKSDLKDVLPLQDAVNMLFTNMMVASEFAALPQKYIISTVEVEGKLQNAPNAIWELPAGDGLGAPTQAGQFAAATLDNFTKPIEQLSSTIGILTRTPKHYFFAQGGDPSGEALIAMEAPLNKKAADRIKRFIPAWREFAAFLLLLAGQKVRPQDIAPVFERPETIQPKTQADVITARVGSTMPLKTALRKYEGWNDDDFAQMEKDKKEEADANQANLADAVLGAARKFDQGDGPGMPQGQKPGANVAPAQETEGGTNGTDRPDQRA